MPKDNEVDEKVMPVAWRYWNVTPAAHVNILGPGQYEYIDAGKWYPDRAEPLYSTTTVAELRAEVERLALAWRSERDASQEYARDCLVANKMLVAAERRVGELEADARELREELEQSQHGYALLANESIYDGNSIGWIASKAKNYGDALLLAWGAVKEVGGTCDGNTPLHEAIRKQLTKADKLAPSPEPTRHDQ